MLIEELDTPESIAQWVISNRYPKSEFDKVSDFEMFQILKDNINFLLNKQWNEFMYPNTDGK